MALAEKEQRCGQAEFNQLLAWLGPDRELAGKKYEEIRFKLARIFLRRGCTIAEELADETMDRVCCKVQEIAETYVGDPALYFFGVAQNVYREYVRKKPDPKPFPALTAGPDREKRYECLEQCLKSLDLENRQLILNYFQYDKGAKIQHRKRMAKQLGVSLNTLRARAHRIKARLQQCVEDCLSQS